MTRKNKLTIHIVENAVIAALYFVLTIALSDFSYNAIQFRLSEALVLLCFWRPDFTLGLTLGCFLANILSPIPLDILFGTLATLISCFLISYASPRLYVALLYPVLINGFIVSCELYYTGISPDFWLNALYVGLGELAVIGASYFLWMSISHNKGFMKALSPTIHQDIFY